MPHCPLCRAPNPDYAEGNGDASDPPPSNDAEPNPRPRRAEQEAISVDAKFEALQAALTKFRENHGKDGRIVGVFGSPDSGKSFLNARLESLLNAVRDGTTGSRGPRVIRATEGDTATWTEFSIKGPSGRLRQLLVVDLPGEEFNRSTGDEPLEVRQYNEVLQAADGLMIYISADVIDDPDRFQPNACLPDRAPEQHYVSFLRRAFDSRPRSRQGFCDLPVFVALSRADRVLGTSIKSKMRDPWQYLCIKSTPLAALLCEKFTTFSCGFVASHVGAEARVAIGFRPRDGAQTLRDLQDPIGRALRGAPLEQYFRACLKSFMTGGGYEIQRLPRPEEMQECGLDEQAFSQAAAWVARGANQFVETRARIEHLVSITTGPIADDRQPSFGVRSMMERLIDLMDEPEDGIYRGNKFDMAAGRAPGSKSHSLGLYKDVAAWVARHLPSNRSAGDRIVRWLRLGTKTQMSRFWQAVVAALATIAIAGVYFTHAVPQVGERREGLRQTVRGVTGLPVGFALDQDAVWDLKPDRLQSIYRSFTRNLNGLRLHTDHLVQRPDFSVALGVNEANQQFHALWPVARSAAGERARAFQEIIDCSTVRSCQLRSERASLTVETAELGTEGARVLFYYAGLNAYLRNEPRETIQPFLGSFEKARSALWPGGPNQVEQPTKQLLLPKLAQQLMLAHARFRDELALAGDLGRGAYQAYGKELLAALDDYLRQSAELTGNGRLRTDLNQELNLIGVDSNVLAAHLLGTAIAETNSYAQLPTIAVERINRLTRNSRTGVFEDLEKYSAAYPDLLCLFHHLLRQDSVSGYSSACRHAEADTSPFRAERRLVDPRFWAADRSGSDIAFEKWAPMIRDAARRAQEFEDDPAALAALRSLSQLPEERPAWRVMLEPPALWLCGVGALLAAILGWLLVGFWQLILAAHRLVSPYTQDQQLVS